jgi:predicted DNA-binding transcriptional regulator YafY
LELEPLHSSQTLQKNKNGSVSIEVKVNITPEFVNRILSFGPYCKVEQPAELVATIRDAVNSMKKLYSK